MPARRLACGLLSVLAVCRAHAPARRTATLPAAVRAAADGITAAALARDLDYFASDALRGRDTASPGFDAAATYIEARLKARRPHARWRCGHVPAALRPARIAGEHRQGGRSRLPGAASRSARTSSCGRSPAPSSDGARGVRRARLARAGARVASRGPASTYAASWCWRTGRARCPRAPSIEQIGRVSVGASSVFAEAKARGAVGVLFLTASDPEGRLDQAMQSGQPASGARSTLSCPRPTPRHPSRHCCSHRPAADALLAGERIDAATLLARGEKGDYPRSFQLARRIRVHVPLASVASERPFNVVAMIEGSDPVLKQQYVTIASHLDGAVGTREVDGDRIYNAADDNATGSAGTLAIAEQIMKGPRPKRSLIFIWDSGEERGLWGTRRFVHQPPVPLDRDRRARQRRHDRRRRARPAPRTRARPTRPGRTKCS